MMSWIMIFRIRAVVNRRMVVVIARFQEICGIENRIEFGIIIDRAIRKPITD
tara:strand:+ start:16325 stop:16480 length:156 start_codon:yes stop_codon:yes gene_type:complete